jgi:hypothetical protein
MALFEGKTPAERNKMIAAIVLPVLAFLFVLRMLFGGSGPSRPATANTNANRKTTTANSNRAAAALAEETAADSDFLLMREIRFDPPGYGGLGSGRNIFAFHTALPRPVGPPPSATPAEVPQPTPPPPPPILLAALAPQSVFAGTGGFTMQLSGDKFGPEARVYIDNQEVPTQYRSMQQLTATVPASVIAGQGQRQVLVRTPDGQFFSNAAVLNVMQPPQPTYTYVGMLKHTRHTTAVLKDQRGELYSVREGDLVEGRFRVTNITDKLVQLVDKDLNVKHSMTFVESRNATPGRAPGAIQPPPPPDDGDEP